MMQQIELTEYDILKTHVDYYFAKMVGNGQFLKAKDVMRRLRAYVDQKLAIIEKTEMKRRYGATCPKCRSDEVEWIEKVHDCQDCAVWVISCLDCKCEWVDVVWKNK